MLRVISSPVKPVPLAPSPKPTPSPPRNALDLVHEWRGQGWQVGVPIHLQKWAELVDANFCKRLICPGCKGHGMNYRPFFKGRGYRVLATCDRCGCGEEI